MENEQKPVVRRVVDSAPLTKVEKKMTEDTEQLLLDVGRKIKLCENKLLFDGSREPSLYDLNRAISEWPHAHLSLIMLYETAAWDLTIAEESYKEYLNDKIAESRQSFNNSQVAKNMWLSATEIESFTKSKYKTELAELSTKKAIAERQKSTMLRILGSWENYSFQLNQLSKNSVAEVQGQLRSANSDFHPGD